VVQNAIPKKIEAALDEAPFSVDLLTAIAMQETGYLWRVMVEKKLSVADILLRCLFRWLSDFGPRFGWRATGTLTKLQEAANLGGLGIIVARRRDDGRPGHIVMVVPEIDSNRARRNPMAK
jgi:hypothetical protein